MLIFIHRLLDPMRQLRRKGHCIQPGDTTHEDVARDYMQLFVKKSLLESIGKMEAGQRASELKKILEVCMYSSIALNNLSYMYSIDCIWCL